MTRTCSFIAAATVAIGAGAGHCLAQGDLLAEQAWNGDLNGDIFNYMSTTQIPWESLNIDANEPNVTVTEFFTVAFWRQADGINCLQDLVFEVRSDDGNGQPDMSGSGLVVSVPVDHLNDVEWNELGPCDNGGWVVELTWSIPTEDQFELPTQTDLWLSYYVPSNSPGFFGGMRAETVDNFFWRQNGAQLESWNADVVYTLRGGAGGGFALEVSGSCPGQMTFSATGATPNDRVAFAYGFSSGSTPVPPCPGLNVDINNAQLGALETADANGDATVVTNVPPAACGRVIVQAVDLGDCSTSNVVEL